MKKLLFLLLIQFLFASQTTEKDRYKQKKKEVVYYTYLVKFTLVERTREIIQKVYGNIAKMIKNKLYQRGVNYDSFHMPAFYEEQAGYMYDLKFFRGHFKVSFKAPSKFSTYIELIEREMKQFFREERKAKIARHKGSAYRSEFYNINISIRSVGREKRLL